MTTNLNFQTIRNFATDLFTNQTSIIPFVLDTNALPSGTKFVKKTYNVFLPMVDSKDVNLLESVTKGEIANLVVDFKDEFKSEIQDNTVIHYDIHPTRSLIIDNKFVIAFELDLIATTSTL